MYPAAVFTAEEEHSKGSFSNGNLFRSHSVFSGIILVYSTLYVSFFGAVFHQNDKSQRGILHRWYTDWNGDHEEGLRVEKRANLNGCGLFYYISHITEVTVQKYNATIYANVELFLFSK